MEYIVLKNFYIADKNSSFLIFSIENKSSEKMNFEYIYYISENKIETNKIINFENTEEIKNNLLYSSTDLMKVLKMLPTLVSMNKYNL